MRAILDQDFELASLPDARECQAGWAATPVRKRLRFVRGFRHLLAKRAESLAIAAAGAL